MRLSLAELVVCFVDRDLVLGDDRIQLRLNDSSVDHGGVHTSDGVGLDLLRAPQPGTGTLVNRPAGGSRHRDSCRSD
jgi:hypothetical protein